jgi:hypothetical protein
MKKAALLINGVSLPYHVLDKGIELSKNNGNAVKAIIIYQHNDDDDRYIFPSDIEMSKAEFSESNAEKSLHDLITHNEQFVQGYYKRHDAKVETAVLQNPSMEEIAEAVEGYEKVVMDPETYRHPEESAYVNISYDEFSENLASRIEWCNAD